MSPYLEVIIPAALAVYAGFHHEGRCTIEPAAHRLAENMCQGLRAALEDGCQTLLEVPLGGSGIYLAGSYSMKPVAFPPLVKEKIREGYAACVGFWSDTLDYNDYRIALEQKASVLNAMFKAVGNPAGAAPLLDAAAANGARRAEVLDTRTAASDLRQDCPDQAQIRCHHMIAPPREPIYVPPDPETLNRLSAAVSDLANEVKHHNAWKPGPMGGVSGTWKLAAEISFATGSFTPGPEQCARLSASVMKAAPKARRLYIAASADERGTPAGNNTLSLQRAATAAQCLAANAPSAQWSMDIAGMGSLATAPAEYARARRATIFASDEQP